MEMKRILALTSVVVSGIAAASLSLGGPSVILILLGVVPLSNLLLVILLVLLVNVLVA